MEMSIRPRRLRGSEVLRKMVRETRMDKSSLIYPIFVKEGTNIKEEIPTMPGQYRYSVDTLPGALEELLDAGVNKVMFFGIPDHKDEVGSQAYAQDGIVQKALEKARAELKNEMYLITDVCMCEYTSHGHCGVLCGTEVENDQTLELLAKTALSHVQAGADMVAPSDMMDGRVRAIREILDANNHKETPIMSYAVKYASAFYGPFRDAAGSAPSFGDRKSYQMDFHNRREGLKEAILDVEEGADIIMVKPALSYLDMIREVKDAIDLPVAAYSVSGEYAMVKAGAKLGYIEEDRIICEMAASAYRAGTDIYLTYFAKEIVKRIPGGVNSPVRAYGSVTEAPRFIQGAVGSKIFDVDGNAYIDYIDSWGPMILGHNDERIKDAVIRASENGLSFGCATEKEVEMAEFICERIPHVEMIRMVNSGTEAVMSALRVARGFTGKSKIIKFAGCYHGHTDAMLVSAGSGVMTSGVPDSAGVPKGCTEDTMIAMYNNLESVERLLTESNDQVAAVIVEPVGANMGVVPPEDGFLQGLRRLCDEHGALLIFDEVITGFRLSFSGAAGFYQVTPDLVTYGKIIGAGMPVGAYGGRKEIMEMVAPAGPVYQAGTLSGNPIAMAAGLEQLKILWEDQEIYTRLYQKGQVLYDGIRRILLEKDLPYQVNSVSSLGCIFFTEEKVKDYATAKTSDTKKFADYFQYMLNHGVHMAPSQFEAMFLSDAHTQEDIGTTLDLINRYF